MALALILAAATGPALAQAPLSVIDWLQESFGPAAPDGPEPGTDQRQPVTPDSGNIWADDGITMRPIGSPRPEAVGLFPAERAGLARDLWVGSDAEEIAALLRGLPHDTLPALRGLALALLLAEFDPPGGAPTAGAGEFELAEGFLAFEAAPPWRDDEAATAFVRARIDRLFAFGALDQAAALLDTLSPRDTGLRARSFEIALLLGREDEGCDDVLLGEPPFPGLAERIFCLARAGRWPEAERHLRRGVESDALGPAEAALLERFLYADDLLHDEDEPLERLSEESMRPPNLSALAWRLLEAIGAPVASHGLPVAYAHADLRGTIGWRAQLEAAERLVRSGALPANRLLGLYTERSAAASGGIWERVRAVQRLEAALASGAPGDIGAALTDTWPQIVDGELETAFAALYAQRLLAVPLEGDAEKLAAIIGLLDTDPAPAGERLRAGNERERFLAAIALGQPPRAAERGADTLQRTIAEALAEEPPALRSEQRALIEAGRGGEALLLMLAGLTGEPDPRALGEGLALMRHLGLDNASRASALQALLLERRG